MPSPHKTAAPWLRRCALTSLAARWAGTLPPQLFNRFAGMQVAAQVLAGVPDQPIAKWANVQAQLGSTWFTSFPTTASPSLPTITTAKGAQFASVVKNLTGSERPLFVQGFEYGGSFRFAKGGFNGDGTINCILTQSAFDTQDLRYTIDGDTAATSALNAAEQKLSAQPETRSQAPAP